MSRTIAIVGATGAVGVELRRIVQERNVPHDRIVLLASHRSAGQTVEFMGQEVVIQNVEDEGVFDGVDIALFSAGGDRSRDHAPRAVEAGALVVDNSSAFRGEDEVPLVVVGVNDDVLSVRPGRGIVANPNCTTMAAMLPMQALHKAYGLTEMVCSTYQATSGAGQHGIDELFEQVDILRDQRDLLQKDGAAAAGMVTPETFARAIAFNAVPMLGSMTETGYTDEELKLLYESRKILGIPTLKVAPTCVRIPVVSGHSIAIRATFAKPVTRQCAIEVLSNVPGLVYDELCTPLEFAGRDEVAVGRVRADLFEDNVLNLWCVGDNLLKGAALNTVQIAEVLIANGLA